MRLLTWRPRVPGAHAGIGGHSHGCVPGAYAGRAQYRPRSPAKIPAALHLAIGQVVEVGCAGIAAPGDRFAGQVLYLEWRHDTLLDGYVIPEQDLEFLTPSRPEVPPLLLQYTSDADRAAV
jgi:hypothetical protein